jgi:AcrR family transcriptional regulator
MFGKPGRPPEDRIGRRREIWAAVAPLIERLGARRLTMRQAARAASMSVGGLYHYFSNKRALVLYGMDREALERGCHEFMIRYGHLPESDPNAMVHAFIRFFAGEAAFLRPAIKAALALGADDFLPQLGEIVNIGLDGFTHTLRLALPEAPESDLHALALATRRLFFASLVDWTVTPETFEAELGALVEGARSREGPRAVRVRTSVADAVRPSGAVPVRSRMPEGARTGSAGFGANGR